MQVGPHGSTGGKIKLGRFLKWLHSPQPTTSRLVLQILVPSEYVKTSFYRLIWAESDPAKTSQLLQILYQCLGAKLSKSDIFQLSRKQILLTSTHLVSPWVVGVCRALFRVKQASSDLFTPV